MSSDSSRRLSTETYYSALTVTARQCTILVKYESKTPSLKTITKWPFNCQQRSMNSRAFFKATGCIGINTGIDWIWMHSKNRETRVNSPTIILSKRSIWFPQCTKTVQVSRVICLSVLLAGCRQSEWLRGRSCWINWVTSTDCGCRWAFSRRRRHFCISLLSGRRKRIRVRQPLR